MIFITDIHDDVDDVGAISLAANSGQKVYGLIGTHSKSSVGGTLMVLDKHYDLGARIGLDRRGEPVNPSRDFYSSALPREFKTGRDRVVGASKALRQALRDVKRDGERVPIISIGSSGTLDRFLKDRPEKHGQLIRDAVSGLYVMAGNFQDGSSEFNVRLNPSAAQSIASRWPTRITYAGFELGRDLLTGEVLRGRPGPTQRAYQLYPRRGVVENKPSYDLVATAAAMGAPGLGVSRRGTVRFSSDGRTSFSVGGGNRRFLRFTNRARVSRWVNRKLS
jgi:hypothetical protein